MSNTFKLRETLDKSKLLNIFGDKNVAIVKIMGKVKIF